MAVARRDRDLALEELHEEALVVDPRHAILDGHVVDRLVVRALDVRARQELVDRVAEPNLIAVGELLRADAAASLTNVPFVELRSSTHQLPSSSTNSRACWRDTELRLTTKPASLSRPTMYWLLTSGMRRPMSGPGGCRLTRHASPAGPASSRQGRQRPLQDQRPAISIVVSHRASLYIVAGFRRSYPPRPATHLERIDRPPHHDVGRSTRGGRGRAAARARSRGRRAAGRSSWSTACRALVVAIVVRTR